MREKPWAVIQLINTEDHETCWHVSEIEALMHHRGESVSIQYRPGRKPKVKK